MCRRAAVNLEDLGYKVFVKNLPHDLLKEPYRGMTPVARGVLTPLWRWQDEKA